MHFGKPGLLIIILIANGVPGRAASPSLDMLIADKMLVQTFHAPFPGAWAHGEGRPELSVRPGSLEPGCLTCAKPQAW